MKADELEPGTVVEPVPLFPLPQTVLFPGARLPLHIFEPRYRMMTRDILQGDGWICISLVPSSERESSFPLVAATAGLGTIVQHRKLPDGRYDLLVEGRARVQLTELPFRPPYRQVRCEVPRESHGTLSDSDIAALVTTAAGVLSALQKRDKTLQWEVPEGTSAGGIADLYSHILLQDEEQRQAILECFDLRERVVLCSAALALQQRILAGPDADVWH